MKLAEWLAVKRMTVEEFGRLTALSLPTIYKALNDKKIARMSAYRIKVCTDSHVDIENMYK